jgi:hypothetical protein
VRPHGVYEAADLRAACEQALAFQRQVENALRASRCAGARFVFSKGAGDPGVKLRKAELAALPAHAARPSAAIRTRVTGWWTTGSRPATRPRW